MRFFTYGVGAQLVNELDIAGAVDRIIHDGRDIIHLRLITGESLMIHLIDSAIPLYEIKSIIEKNTGEGHHTLFILWSDMLLPDHGRVVALEDWHAGLLALYDDHIYAYKVYMQQLYVFPIYFDRQPYVSYRHVRYGDPIDVGGLRCRTVPVDVPGLNGAFFVAGFDGDPDAYHRQRARNLDAAPAHQLDPYFAVLGVDMDADRATVKAAFRRLARLYHPDINSDDADANARMQEINVAYEMIIRAMDDAES